METHWLPSKEKVSGAAVNKAGHTDSFWDMKGAMTTDFLEKSATVKNASYC